MKLDTTTASERDKPIYNSFKELKANGFTLSPGICVFIASVHTAALALGVWLYAAAPAQWVWAGTAWLMHQNLNQIPRLYRRYFCLLAYQQRNPLCDLVLHL